MVDLDEKYILEIKKIIGKCLTHYTLYLFGSRTKGTSKKYSDVDLAILSGEMSEEIKSKLDFLFEESTLPYKIDIIDLSNIKENFYNSIKDSLVKI